METSKGKPFEEDPEKSENFSLQENYEAISIPRENLQTLFPKNFCANHEDFIALKQKADGGSADAQFETSYCYWIGKNVRPAFKLAFRYSKLAADQGHCGSQNLLAFFYNDGIGVKQDYQKAFYYYQLAAQQGSAFALACLGKFYEMGLGGVEKSPQEAIRCYEMASDFDNSLAWKYLAEAYETGIGVGKSIEKANFYRRKVFLTTQKEADEGDAFAQASLGLFFENGIGVEKSIESALKYYQMSADQNCPNGLLCLADCFAQGKGIQISSDKAIHYYKLAADQGYILAQSTLAGYLIKTKINPSLAVRYFKLVIQSGEKDLNTLRYCECHLARCFEDGIGVKQSITNALYYYKKAAEHGEFFSQNRLGEAYRNGELGLKKSTEKAFFWYLKAAEQGSAIDLEIIGKFYEKGECVAQSFEKAFQFYQSAAEIGIREGYGRSIYNLARCYEKGIGTEKSLEKAIYNYKLAAENGFKDGYYSAGLCYKQLGGEENAKKAFAFFKMAAAENDVNAQRELAEGFKQGYGVEKSESEATRYTKLAKDEYAKLVEELDELKKDDKEYFKILKILADEGNSYFQLQVAEKYAEGIGVKQSAKDALKYYKLVADKGNIYAQYKVGRCHAKGEGTPQSWEQAFKYYQLAAHNKQSHPVSDSVDINNAIDKEGRKSALLHLTACYRDGKGCEKSGEKFAEYYDLWIELEQGKPIEKEIQPRVKKQVTDTLKKRKINAKKYTTPSRITSTTQTILAQTGDSFLQAYLPREAIAYPGAKLLDVSEYIKDKKPETLRNTFKKFKDSPIYLSACGLSKAEIEIIRDAMIENRRFTFMCPKNDLDQLFDSFSSLGYDPKACIKCAKFNDKDCYGLVFIKYFYKDIRKRKLETSLFQQLMMSDFP